MDKPTNLKLQDFLAMASKLTHNELDHLLICSFCPPIESFDSIEDARKHYASFALTEWEFFNHYIDA